MTAATPEREPLDGALIALVSAALHQRCVRDWDDRAATSPGVAQTFHGPDAHDHGAVDVVAALRAHDWVCTHRQEPTP